MCILHRDHRCHCVYALLKHRSPESTGDLDEAVMLWDTSVGGAREANKFSGPTTHLYPLRPQILVQRLAAPRILPLFSLVLMDLELVELL